LFLKTVLGEGKAERQGDGWICRGGKLKKGRKIRQGRGRKKEQRRDLRGKVDPLQTVQLPAKEFLTKGLVRRTDKISADAARAHAGLQASRKDGKQENEKGVEPRKQPEKKSKRGRTVGAQPVEAGPALTYRGPSDGRKRKCA